MKKRIFALAAGATLFSSACLAAPVSVGLGIGMTDPGYKDYSVNYYPIPNISFDNGIFFIDGLHAGVYAYNDPVQSFSLGLRYLPLSFRSSKTDNKQLEKLDNRKGTVLAEMAYDYDFSWGTLAASAGVDILNESNTFLIDMNYSRSQMFAHTFVLTPTVGVIWFNKKHNEYYYGVDKDESRKSGLDQFSGDSGFQPYISLTGTYLINQDWSVYLGARVDKITGDTQHSPMLSHSFISSGYAGVLYTF